MCKWKVFSVIPNTAVARVFNPQSDSFVNMGEEEKHLDCIIIGAGISGLDAAYHIKVH